jgi:hypothetical protein
MELKALAGEHLFDAVDFSNEQVKIWGDEFEACQVMRFRLDGNVYVAVEDPSDGYRSCMNELTVSEDAAMKNVFGPVKVIGRHRDTGDCEEPADVLELIDAGTGKIVLEVGTENTNDYYPYFVAAFHPEAMTPNVEVSGGAFCRPLD